nr:hypothetical protein I302_00142 [Kwoniella bestiolae CBS 10118]OCF28653.1 hypothetical protein I302_00142 [Kwoniella bestiolae CBS 10118]
MNAGVHALPTFSNFTTRQSGESHQITLINNCGSGKAVFVYENHSIPSGSQTISGEVRGGLAWMSGMQGTNCGDNGLNCGMVEFSLVNSQGGGQNAGDYSLLDGLDDEKGDSLGEHTFQYSMDFAFTGACTLAPGACTGDSAAQCPGAYLDSATEGGANAQCLADNVGISITFCVEGSAAAPIQSSAPAGTAVTPVQAGSATAPGGTVPPGGTSSAPLPAGTGVPTSQPANPSPPASVPPNGAGSIAEGEPSIATVPSPYPTSVGPTTTAVPPQTIGSSSKPAWGGGRVHWTRTY